MLHNYCGCFPEELGTLMENVLKNIFWDFTMGRGHIHYIYNLLKTMHRKSRKKIKL
jgi:hypothetical protein